MYRWTSGAALRRGLKLSRSRGLEWPYPHTECTVAPRGGGEVSSPPPPDSGIFYHPRPVHREGEAEGVKASRGNGPSEPVRRRSAEGE